MKDTILSLLQGNVAFMSGEEISCRLGITRAAVWKKVIALRKKGFIIEAVRSKGYRLISAPDLSQEYLMSHLPGGLWKEVLVYDSVESTNELAMSLAAKDDIPSGTVFIADLQTRGKGRLGRKWESPKGMNISMSLLIRPDLRPRDATMLTVLSAVSAVSALQKRCGIPVSIKWPNDLMTAGKKLGGILTEVRADPDRINIAVIGIGINVNMTAGDVPESLQDIATSVRQAKGEMFCRNEIIIQILRDFDYWYRILETVGRTPLLDAWRKNSSTLGRNVIARTGETSVSGKAIDIDDDGMLILQLDSGGLTTIRAGDITLLRSI